MPIGDIWQLSVDGLAGASDNWTQVHHFRQASADPPSSVGDSLMDAYEQDVQPEHLAIIVPPSEITGYRARRVFPNPTQQVTKIVTASGLNSDVNGHSNNVSALVAWYGTPVAGTRVKTGGTNIAGIAQSNVIGGLITTVLIALLQAYLTKLVENITDTGTTTDWKKVIWNTVLETASEIVTATERPATRKIRSRTKGQGS